MDKSIFIILVDYNGSSDTLECIDSLKQTSYSNYSIVVVDNAPTEDNMDKIIQKWNDVVVIRNKENVGFAKANNIGIRYALDQNADFIILLNNDTVVTVDFMPMIMEKFTKYSIDILTCAIKYYADKERFWYAGGEFRWSKGYGIHYTDDRLNDEINEINFVTGCCLIAKSAVFKQILLPEDYFMYFEDVDYCLELSANNIHMYYTPDVTIYHKVSSSVGVESPFFVYYWNRNRIILLKKYRDELGITYYGCLLQLLITRTMKVLIYLIDSQNDKAQKLIKGCIDGFLYKVIMTEKDR